MPKQIEDFDSADLVGGFDADDWDDYQDYLDGELEDCDTLEDQLELLYAESEAECFFDD